MSEEKRTNVCPKCGSKIIVRQGIFIFCTESSCDWAIQSKRKEDIQIPLFSQIKPVAEIILKFTSGSYKCMHETIRKLKDFIYRLNPAIKDGLLEDMKTLSSLISSAEKKGKNG